jgi:uncharacterized protein
MEPKQSFVSPKIVLRESAIGGKGLFTQERIAAGEIVIDYSTGPGRMISQAAVAHMNAAGRDYDIQIDDDLFFASMNSDDLEDADYINHSCNPNCGMRGALTIVAMRDIQPGEEITFDYCMFQSGTYQLTCHCAQLHCRKQITGNDWKRIELQQKYAGFFSPYLQKKIELASQRHVSSNTPPL